MQTGYLSTENDTKHFYFAYFESRASPEKDPLLMWINGGPGCSSMMGLLMEQGTSQIVLSFVRSSNAFPRTVQSE
jgi:cathepsin A (carboxypeptidase C)